MWEFDACQITREVLKTLNAVRWTRTVTLRHPDGGVRTVRTTYVTMDYATNPF